ncbi:hypothetical protein [Aureliella helgolandensis]|uniref:Uncharacterized protein n=1 Tax=Aureliella helgolandensis TaxID=2527968 RepID=A0A518GHP5_9BACT|nr:hypothetical protein [Aureliella helgolandensis]QDV28121.1 hypothetical protein Q31a_65160 [Aureliella helgolandensis]
MRQPNDPVQTGEPIGSSESVEALRALLSASLHAACHQLQWTTASAEQFAAASTGRGSACLLKRLCDAVLPPDSASRPVLNPVLNPVGLSHVKDLVEHGYSLQDSWRPWQTAIEHWLGRRLYFGHASLFARTTNFVTIASSRMGRFGRLLPQWPQRLEAIFRECARRRQRLLVAPGTAASQLTLDLAQLSHVPRCSIGWPNPSTQSLVDWLVLTLTQTPAESADRYQVHLSPPVHAATKKFDRLPIQDRAAIALADTVFAISVRPRGVIGQLLLQRLQNTAFPTASVFVALESNTLSHPQRSASCHWLKLGAVGWYSFNPPATVASRIEYCKRIVAQECSLDGSTDSPAAKRRPSTPMQLCAAMPKQWRTRTAQDWTFLSHCTRGQEGPGPMEELQQYHWRSWLGGRQPSHPLLTLYQILQSRRLVGTSAITRTMERCVCFSACPLPQLLDRRTYQSHLGRWDWEPYGLMIRASALSALGARPVVYGTEADYRKLSDDQRPYFQPHGKHRANAPRGWREEQEWRIVGDVLLEKLPREDVQLFVRTRCEALQIARRFPWSVFWFAN